MADTQRDTSQFETIYDYVVAQENAYNQGITILDGYNWSMKEHLKTSTLYKNSIFTTGKDENKPFKNITRPLLNLQYRAEDIDVKDVLLYVDDPDYYHLSLLLKKYHDHVYTVEHNIDEFMDEVKESKVDYGAGLAMKNADGLPETRSLLSIAFCDQTNLLSGPLAFKDFYSPDELKEMEANHWGDTSYGATIAIDDLIELAQETKTQPGFTSNQARTPGKYVEVYLVMGSLKKRYYTDDPEDKGYLKQFQIIAFYRDTKGERKGVTLFKSKKAPELKLLSRDKIYGRALGLGGAEELFEPQVWTNYDVIRMKELLDAASKVVLITNDPTLANKHPSGLKDVDNLEIIEEMQGGNTRQLDTVPRNMVLFEKSVAEWEVHAQQMSGATDALMGQNPTAGTPFKLQDLIVQQGKGLHDYRQGKNAKFFEEVYRDWIIPQMAKEIVSGTKFLAELSVEELQYVADCLIRNKANEYFREKLFSFEPVTEQEIEDYKAKLREDFMRSGNKRFIEILKDEFKDLPIKVRINIKGKQNDLASMVDKLSNVMRFAFSTFNPQTGTFGVFEDPRMAKLFNEIITFSGLSAIDFADVPKSRQGSYPQVPQEQMQQGQAPMPMPQLQAN